jgi:chromosome segregation protein
MRIQRLDITGFKSFTDRAVFSFADGVTGIVGPNGCGKSNVVDAVRWVMGEQSAKQLRGRAMEDVIFNGSESRPALSMAEVSLKLSVEESDALAPQFAGLPEITVTRRLFRNGDSEYLINKTACRLLDVTELFLGTGVGTRAYSIIEQGRVGMIVSAKPEDRRAFIEEAAGVTKYKARRKAAEHRMEYTQQNLLRITDIVSELEKRVESLSRQVKKADKYKKLKEQIREIELHSASHRFLELHAQLQALQAKLTGLTAEERSGLERVRQLEETIERSRAQLDRDAQVLQALQQDAHTLESRVQLADQRLAHLATDADETGKRLEKDGGELEAQSLQRGDLDGTLQAAERHLQDLLLRCKKGEVALEVAQEELRRVNALQAQLLHGLSAERDTLVEIAARLANHESNLVNLDRRKAELETRRAKNRAEADALSAQQAALEQSRQALSEHLAGIRQATVELAERRGLEETSLDGMRVAFAENEIKVISLREELGDKRARLSSLEEIQRSYEGFDRGVRALMLRAGGEDGAKVGVHGLIADVIRAPAKFEKAIEAALGERLQSVIVDDRPKALELIEYLKSASEGRSSFLPLSGLSPGSDLPAPDLSRPGVLAVAESEVTCDPLFQPLVKALLRGVVIVSDLTAARECASAAGDVFTLVTLEGDVLWPSGAVTGGALEGPAIGVLQKKRQIAELSEEVAQAEAAYNEVLTRHYGLQKQIQQAEGVLKGLAKNQQAEEINLATQEKDLHRTGEDLSRIRQRLAELDQEHLQLSQAHSAAESEAEESRGEVAHGQTDRERREEKLRQMGAELEVLKQRSDASSAELTALKVEVAANAERKDSANKEIEQLGGQRARIDERLRALEQAIREAEERTQQMERSRRETSAARAEDASRLGELTQQLEGLRQAHAEFSGQVRDQDGQLRELRLRLDELSQGLSQLSLQERQMALELSHLSDQVLERHQVDLAQELHRFHLLPRLGADQETRLKELRAQVERLGEINLTAIDEHAEVAERCKFLQTQKQDLESSLLQLKQAIARIDKTSRERFLKTFELVDEKFQKVFPRLFGGGRAALVLTEAEAGGEPGVEIVAQPPGKKLQNVNLLSGGEKALTAVSLIFAIFLIKPTPFCILDEVDAPLDEANVGRYNQMVREISKQSQFILITHNKRTMEVLDTLYGVTMEQPGVSKLVSVRMRDAVAANEDRAA